jgi:hypothetical protein
MVERRAQPHGGAVGVRPSLGITGVKVFSATMRAQRDQLGDIVTAWMIAHPEITIVDVTVVQSSDAAFHCISIVVTYRERRAKP